MLRGRMFSKFISILSILYYGAVFTYLFILGIYNFSELFAGTFGKGKPSFDVNDYNVQSMIFGQTVGTILCFIFLIVLIVYFVKTIKNDNFYNFYYKPAFIAQYLFIFYIIGYFSASQFTLSYMNSRSASDFDDAITVTVLSLFLFITSVGLNLLVSSKYINKVLKYFLFLLILSLTTGILFYIKTMFELNDFLKNILIIGFVGYIFPVLGSFPLLLKNKMYDPYKK